MDEHLLNIIEDGQVDSTVEFFRKYMAGFLISRHETSTSVCGSDYERDLNNGTADTGDLLCMMYGATQSVRGEKFFNDTVYRQMYNLTANCTFDPSRSRPVTYTSALRCPLGDLNEEYMGASPYPGCNGVMFNETSISFMLNSDTTNLTSLPREPNVFQVDGGVRDIASGDAVPNGADGTFGRRHAEIGPSEEMGATIFYNNQVINVKALINSMCNGSHHWTNVYVYTALPYVYACIYIRCSNVLFFIIKCSSMHTYIICLHIYISHLNKW